MIEPPPHPFAALFADSDKLVHFLAHFVGTQAKHHLTFGHAYVKVSGADIIKIMQLICMASDVLCPLVSPKLGTKGTVTSLIVADADNAYKAVMGTWLIPRYEEELAGDAGALAVNDAE